MSLERLVVPGRAERAPPPKPITLPTHQPKTLKTPRVTGLMGYVRLESPLRGSQWPQSEQTEQQNQSS